MKLLIETISLGVARKSGSFTSSLILRRADPFGCNGKRLASSAQSPEDLVKTCEPSFRHVGSFDIAAITLNSDQKRCVVSPPKAQSLVFVLPSVAFTPSSVSGARELGCGATPPIDCSLSL